jgi:DNA-directed RNA polymerase alpha subunit/DNA-directed RNA polymerase subunit L
MEFSRLEQTPDQRTVTFTLSPIHVSYANTLRRLILTGIETVAFRADMTAMGTTTDVVVKRNDTPMTNEMLAARIGLLPIHVPEPLKWKDSEYQFRLNVAGNPDTIRHVTASDIQVIRLTSLGALDEKDEKGQEKEETVVPTERFFPPHPLTGQTCLLASLQPGTGAAQQRIEWIAKATKGTGREHARFSPVSQCSYEYTPDSNPARIQEMFLNWLVQAKKAGGVEKGSDRYAALEREFRTMQIKRCYKIDEAGEPYSFDFTIESVGVLPVQYIVQRACEVGENMCSRYVNLRTGTLPPEITISHANCRLIGYDFLFRGHDHTLGNLLQTWLVQNHIEGNAQPKITYAGFSVPHPLRDEMILRIGVEDGEETTARAAVAAAAQGCVGLFQQLRRSWLSALGAPVPASSTAVSRPRVARPRLGSKVPSASSASSASSVTVTKS